MPCSMPSRAHASAVTCAAKGVDLREPLKPAAPADFQAMTFPSRSVRATIVLLNDVLMCAWPIATFLRVLRRGGPRAAAARRGGGGQTAGGPFWERGGRWPGPPLFLPRRTAFFSALPGRAVGGVRVAV